MRGWSILSKCQISESAYVSMQFNILFDVYHFFISYRELDFQQK